jgi:hypothetical protein
MVFGPILESSRPPSTLSGLFIAVGESATGSIPGEDA